MLSSPSFRSVSVFSINSLILPGFPLTSFYLAKASISAFLCFYTLVYVVVQKYLGMAFKIIHIFQYSFCNQPVLFSQLENVNKLWKNNSTMQVSERNQRKSKAKFKFTRVVRFSPLTVLWYH